MSDLLAYGESMCVGLLLVLAFSCALGQNRHNVSRGGADDGGWEECDESCPTWTRPGSDSCACGSTLGDIVRCNLRNVSIRSGYCMTYDSAKNATYAASCPYGLKDAEMYRPLPCLTSDLTSAMCDPLFRQGRVCGQCRPGYGSGVFSADVNCYRCSGVYHGWPLYLLFELFPITLLFLFIMMFHCRGTAASLNGFLFFSQMIVSIYHFFPPDGSYPFGHASNILIRFYLIAYGFLNLDFFRQVVPPFCVSEQITGLHMIALLYLPVIYLLLLSVLMYILIEMHAHNCRFLVWVWRPLHKYYVKVHRNVNPHNSQIDAFTTSLIFSYSRLMLVSFILLHPTPLYAPTGKKVKYAVYFDGTIDYFSSQHMPFVILSIAVIVFFNVLPIIFLCIHPTKTFQKVLGKTCSRRCALMLYQFADSFQGCYKSGTDGKKDYRYFAGLYLALRFVVCVGHTLGSHLDIWLVPGLCFLIAALLFANLRPYRLDIFNTFDSLWFSLGAVFALCQTIIFTKGVESSLGYQIIVQVLLGIPLGYIICYNVYLRVMAPLSRMARRMRQQRSRMMIGALSGPDNHPYHVLE